MHERSAPGDISPLPADCPIASPSEKLWRPIPIAIISASQAADVNPTGAAASLELGRRRSAPGPSIFLRRWAPIQLS